LAQGQAADLAGFPASQAGSPGGVSSFLSFFFLFSPGFKYGDPKHIPKPPFTINIIAKPWSQF
jgi:hypothetical protein